MPSLVSLPDHVEDCAGKNELARMRELIWLAWTSEHLVSHAEAASSGEAKTYRKPCSHEISLGTPEPSGTILDLTDVINFVFFMIMGFFMFFL